MRILLFLEQLAPGGVEYYFLRKAHALRARGHDIRFASAGGPLADEVAAAGFEHLALRCVAQARPEVPHAEALAQARLLARYLDSREIEAISAVAVRPFQFAYPLARDRGIPLFLECLSPVHFVPAAQADWVREVAEAGRFFGIVRDDLDLACARLGLPPGLGQVMPNPIDLARFRRGPEILRASLGAADDEFVVLTVCRLDRDKATYVGWLIDEYVSLAAAGGAEPWLAIAGEGSERAALEARVAAAGLARVRFLGRRDDPERLYPGADAFVGMGTTVLEAAACGAPVVLANALSLRPGAVGPDGAAVGLFGQDGTASVGYPIPGAGAGRFGPHLARLRADPALRKDLAERGARIVTARHSLAAVAERWEAAFAASLAGSAPRGLASAAAAAHPRAAADASAPWRILFVSRPDLLAVPGGDTTQVLQTKVAMERRGIHVDISLATAPDAAGYTLAHVFDLQLADLAREQIATLAASGVPVVVSPIFWDHAELEAVAPALRARYRHSGPVAAPPASPPVPGSAG
ncbi:MAG: glycosyltransferase family 4 protein, partial [Candidatus Sericytochromatia bacterium]|nr:glycosyltransferase family 4 protein [Candidatus Tanganyikabacteria bacterium]